jgi:hypothetical protein
MWPRMIAMVSPDMASHSRMERSVEPEASRRPSGENARLRTSLEWPSTAAMDMSSGNVGSCSWTEEPHTTNSNPSGVNTAELPLPVPLRVKRSMLDGASHTLIDASSEPDASHIPSSENAMEIINAVWPVRTAMEV